MKARRKAVSVKLREFFKNVVAPVAAAGKNGGTADGTASDADDKADHPDKADNADNADKASPPQLSIWASTYNIVLHQVVSFKASPLYPDDRTEEVTNEVTWKASKGNVLKRLDTPSQFKGIGEGTATVSAKHKDKRIKEASVDVTVGSLDLDPPRKK